MRDRHERTPEVGWHALVTVGWAATREEAANMAFIASERLRQINRPSPHQSPAVRWWLLITELEVLSARTGLGLGGIWALVHEGEYDTARARLDALTAEVDADSAARSETSRPAPPPTCTNTTTSPDQGSGQHIERTTRHE